MFTLVAELNVKPDMQEAFLAAVADNSAASLRDEPGCLRFDVVQDLDDPHHYYFYEVYVDAAAFEAHRNAPHFPLWREAAAVCLRDGDGQRNVYGATVYPEPYQ